MTEQQALTGAPQAEAAVTRPPEATGIQGANGDTAEASRNLLASLQTVHRDSLFRNADDTKKDQDAMTGDNASIALAGKAGGLADDLKAYIAKGGDFKDAAGQKLGHQFISALRHERDDHVSDRQTDLQYAGKGGIPQKEMQDAQVQDKAIADKALALADPKTTPEARTQLLKDIAASAGAIGQGLADKTGKAGSDQKDAVSESQVIAADAKALLDGKLTADQNNHLLADIASKAGLIQKELGDAPNEVGYAKHDSAAIRAGADLEAVVRSTMHSHSAKSLHQLTGLLGNFHNGTGEGLLDNVVSDRRADLALEPVYIDANTKDNTINNVGIIEFTDPYVKAK